MFEQEASNPDTSAQRLEELCADPLLRILVASNPATPAHLFALLAHDQDARVRENVAGNPKAPWKTLEQLAWEFPHAFLHNPAGPLHLLASPEQVSRNKTFWEALLREASVPPLWWNWLMSDPTLRLSPALHLHIQYAGETAHPYGVCQPGEERRVLELVQLVTSAWTQRATLPGDRRANQTVSCEQMVQEHLQWLAHSVDRGIRCSVAVNEQTPAEVFCALAQDADAEVRHAVAGNRQAPAEALQTLAHDAEKKVRWAVAENQQAPAEALQTLAQDTEEGVRHAVARNRQTPTEVLQALAQDTEKKVRQAVAANLQTPQEVLQTLAHDAEGEVRSNVAWNRQTPTEVLQTLAQDAEQEVRKYVASNPQTPAEALQTLAQDAEQEVRQWVARNEQTPKGVLQALAQDREQEVRQKVAWNWQTPAEILQTLARDTEEKVQMYARENPQMPVPPEVLQTLAQQATHVRIRVAWKPQTPTEVLQTLAQDADAEVRWLANLALRVDEETENALRSERWRKYLRSFTFYRVPSLKHQLDHIARTKAPNAVLQIILEAFAADWDESLNVDDRYGRQLWKRIMAPFVSPIILQRFASFACWQIRFLVALHEETPWETRLHLCQDGNRYVRAMARAKVAQRAEQEAN